MEICVNHLTHVMNAVIVFQNKIKQVKCVEFVSLKRHCRM